MQKQSVIFITGLGHSGSTLLDMLLSAQNSVIGLGEIDKLLLKRTRERFLKKYHKYPCTCGEKPSDCKIWSNFKRYADNNSGFTFVQGYSKMMEIVGKTDAKYIVDSSKSFKTVIKIVEHLSEIGIDKENFYVIHLSKDIRSFTESATKSTNSISTALYQIYHWVKVNNKIDKYAKDKNLKSINVGYEEVALSTEFTISKIMKFVGADFKNVNTNIRDTNGHILFGNNMRINQSDNIYYDYRWFTNRKFQKMVNFLMPFLNKYNRKWVYSNTGDIMYKKNRTKSFVAAKADQLDHLR